MSDIQFHDVADLRAVAAALNVDAGDLLTLPAARRVRDQLCGVSPHEGLRIVDTQGLISVTARQLAEADAADAAPEWDDSQPW